MERAPSDYRPWLLKRFYGNKAIDRSPGGTGTSARMAQLFAKGRLNVGDVYRLESLIGTSYEGKVEASVKVGTFDGMNPNEGFQLA